mgnify:CR=1 FL=1
MIRALDGGIAVGSPLGGGNLGGLHLPGQLEGALGCLCGRVRYEDSVDADIRKSLISSSSPEEFYANLKQGEEKYA